MGDILIDNKDFYNFEVKFLKQKVLLIFIDFRTSTKTVSIDNKVWIHFNIFILMFDKIYSWALLMLLQKTISYSIQIKFLIIEAILNFFVGKRQNQIILGLIYIMTFHFLAFR